MNELLSKHDSLLDGVGPAALVIREYMIPVEGEDGVIFPATFAASTDGTFKGGYNIDSSDGWNVCLIDSVGSQANRIEPVFGKDGYSGLVPQIRIKAGSKSVNLLEAGHRAGDAIVRCSSLQQELRDAFMAVQNGNAEPLARIAPTSLVFGAWDSRDTQAKLPRLIASTIRAFNVHKLTRSAQYVPAVEYVDEGLIEEPPDLKDAEGRVKSKHPFAQRGFVHVPASGSHGGVIATGGIRRDASLHLAALRLLTAGADSERTLALQRYILGLALTAFTYSQFGYLRQGCNLVLDPDKARKFEEVYGDGRRVPATVTHPEALAYATAAAEEFGINPNRDVTKGLKPDREVSFDRESAKRDVSEGDGRSAKKAQKVSSRKAIR